jgi:hypothetical protein
MKLISYKGMKAESLPALAQGNALCSKRASVLRPEGAEATSGRRLVLLRKINYMVYGVDIFCIFIPG